VRGKAKILKDVIAEEMGLAALEALSEAEDLLARGAPRGILGGSWAFRKQLGGIWKKAADAFEAGGLLPLGALGSSTLRKALLDIRSLSESGLDPEHGVATGEGRRALAAFSRTHAPWLREALREKPAQWDKVWTSVFLQEMAFRERVAADSSDPKKQKEMAVALRGACQYWRNTRLAEALVEEGGVAVLSARQKRACLQAWIDPGGTGGQGTREAAMESMSVWARAGLFLPADSMGALRLAAAKSKAWHKKSNSDGAHPENMVAGSAILALLRWAREGAAAGFAERPSAWRALERVSEEAKKRTAALASFVEAQAAIGAADERRLLALSIWRQAEKEAEALGLAWAAQGGAPAGEAIARRAAARL
jgi:hypothetical protein